MSVPWWQRSYEDESLFASPFFYIAAFIGVAFWVVVVYAIASVAL